MEGSIMVTGKGNISVSPDTTVIIVDLSRTEKKYEDVLKASTEDLKEIKDMLEDLGMKREDLKTSSFNVDSKYESCRDDDQRFRNIFVGYECTQTLRFKFPIDNVLLGKILYRLSMCKCKPRFRILYTMSDPESVRSELMGLAVKDAKAKAAVLADAADVKLGNIVSIEYSRSDMQFDTSPMRNMMCDNVESCASFNIDIEPEDICRSDTVNVIWNIF